MLFLDGVGIVIPPLISIEYQMEQVCQSWKIPYLNISGIPATEIMSSLKSASAKIMIASIESISDVAVQKAIQNLSVNYVAVDECQVSNCLVIVQWWLALEEGRDLAIDVSNLFNFPHFRRITLIFIRNTR